MQMLLHWRNSTALFLTAQMDILSPPQFQTPTYWLPFTLNSTRFHFKIAGLLETYSNFLIPHLTTFAASLKSHTNLFSNHITLRA